MSEVIPSVGHIYFNNDTNKQVVVFYAKGDEVRYSPALVNTGQEFRTTFLDFLNTHERKLEHLDAAGFTSEADISIEEATPLAFTLDTDEEGITFTITGGDDAALFEIEDDQLDFISGDSPDFASPEDVDEDNVYELEITATDDDGNTTVQVMTVTVTETP